MGNLRQDGLNNLDEAAAQHRGDRSSYSVSRHSCGVKNMNRISSLFIAIAFPVAFAAPLAAQEGKTLGTVIDGNATIEFKAADTGDKRPSAGDEAESNSRAS